jgi:hypothetical protein
MRQEILAIGKGYHVNRLFSSPSNFPQTISIAIALRYVMEDSSAPSIMIYLPSARSVEYNIKAKWIYRNTDSAMRSHSHITRVTVITR